MTKPLISVIIATLNEEKHIGALLETFVNNPVSCEILLFDGGSSDRTVEIASSFKKRLRIHIFDNPKQKQVYAFNLGVKQAQGTYFCLIGAHSSIPNDYLSSLLDTFTDVKKTHPRLAAVGSRAKNVGTNWFGRAAALLFESPLSGSGSYRFAKKSGFANTVCFALYDTKAVRAVGGFSEDYITGQDYELNQRLREHGYVLYQNAQVVISHVQRSTFKGFAKQNFRYAKAKGMFLRQKSLFFLPLIFFLLLLGLVAVLLFWPLLLVYALVVLLESLRFGLKGLHLLYLLPISHSLSALGLVFGLVQGEQGFTPKE